MKKNFYILLMLLGLSNIKAQITPSLTIPADIPEYDGTYEKFGQGHLYYQDLEATRYNDEEMSPAGVEVAFHTEFTHPRKYLLRNNNISFNFTKRDVSTGSPIDSLHRVDVEMFNSSSSATLARVDTQNIAVLNYFKPWFSSAGLADVHGGAAIACQSIWPNTDLVYTSNNVGAKMFFILYPGASIGNVVLHINGARTHGIVGNKLRFYSNWDSTTFIKPRMYQYAISGNVVTPVTVCNATWQSLGSNNYGIATTSSYNSSLPLIIEVMEGVAATNTITGLPWSTYFGGSMQDFINKARSDASNNLFVAGKTTSPNFPVNAGSTVVTTVIGSLPVSSQTSDAFVAKFDAAGVLKWVTYMGGSWSEQINDFDFKGGDIYSVGNTFSNDLTVQSKTLALNNSSYGGGGDGFIFQLSANGQTNKWLTYFGGNGSDALNACMFDATSALFVVGGSNSNNMNPVGSAGTYTQTYNTSQPASSLDCIILKLKASTDTLSWFTPYGTHISGANGYNVSDEFFGIDVDGTDVYVCGYSGGTNLPGSINTKMFANFFDGILTKFNTSGALIKAKFTNGNAWNNSVKVRNNKVYVCGLAKLGLHLVNSGKYYYDSFCYTGDDDGCFSIHNLNLDTTIHSSFLGEQGYDEAIDLQFSSNGVFYISGGTSASSFPVTNISGMYNAIQIGVINYFIAAFKDNDTNFVWSTCLGSYNVETDANGKCASMALDGQGFLHVCGTTNSFINFPTVSGNGIPYFQSTSASNATNASSFNGTVTRFDLASLNLYVGVKDFPKTSFSFGFYPNPTSNNLVIENSELQNQTLRFAIYDLQGKKLNDGKLNSGIEKKIDVSFLTPGMYIINVSNGTKTFSNKFVKVEN